MEELDNDELRGISEDAEMLEEPKIKRRGRKSSAKKSKDVEAANDSNDEDSKPKSLTDLCDGALPSLDEAAAVVEAAYGETCRLGAVSNALCEIYKVKLFRRWLTELAAGFSIVLYGVGSKIQLLDDFAQEQLPDFATVTVRGYAARSFTFSKLLRSLRSACKLRDSDALANEADEAKRIGQCLEKTDQMVFIVVHNLDAPAFRDLQFQAAFAKLVSSNRDHICLIATVDHANSMLLWDEYTLNRFRYLFYDVSTYRPYAAELREANGNSGSLFELLAAASGTQKRSSTEQQLAALRSVMQSVPTNARAVFALLARAHLRQLTKQESRNDECSDEEASLFENEPEDDSSDRSDAENDEQDSDGELQRKSAKTRKSVARSAGKKRVVIRKRRDFPLGLTFDELFDAARAQMLVASEATLRAHLNEFADHELIRWRRPGDAGLPSDSLDAERIQLLVSDDTLNVYLTSAN